MGIGYDVPLILNKLLQQGQIPLRGSVIELGAQQLANSLLSASEILELTRQTFGLSNHCPLPEAIPTQIMPGGLEHLAESAPPAKLLWEWLGYNYACIDIDGGQNSISPFDLNYDAVPNQERGQYDIVTNFGTTEHVANQLNAFKIIHDLAKPGGIMWHNVPSQGYLNHGLINYNPKFFWMLARSNGYKWSLMDFTLAPCPYPIPSNIIDHVAEFTDTVPPATRSYETRDCAITVVLQKTFDLDFVAPLDVPTGADAPNDELKQRYWTVFTPNAFG